MDLFSGFLLSPFQRNRRINRKKTTYVQTQQSKTIRRRMTEIINREIGSGDIRQLIGKLIPDSIAKDIEKACSPIYPIHDCYVSKVKVIRRPKVDISRLMELHGQGASKPTPKEKSSLAATTTNHQ